MTNERHILGISGGRDSASLAVYMRQYHPRLPLEYFFTDTGKELPEVYSFLDKLVDFIGMKKQEPPTIFRTDRKLFPDKAGLSGWVPLVESSIVIHTLSKHNFISIDVYSCGAYDPKKVIAFTKRYFKPKKVEQQYIERGKHYFKS